MKYQTRLILVALLLMSAGVQAQTKDIVLPRWGIKTNLLYDATATINLGVEMRTGDHTSVELAGNYNNWEFANDRKWKHYLLQPEFRWWPSETFDGHFFGVHAHGARYNVGHLPKPPFSTYMNTHRMEGWLAGAGISYGYRWNFNHRWALEATLGVGYAYMDYDEFNCGRCGQHLGNTTKHYFGPTKAGVSLIFGIGGEKEPPPPAIYIAPPVHRPVYEPVLRAGFVTPEVEAVKMRSESGSAFLYFIVDRSDILVDFRDNAAELQKIYSSIELVQGNPDATITGLSIVGHASPEASYAYNMRLSERRAEALRNHILSIYDIADHFISSKGEGEDWAGLGSMVSASNMLGKLNAMEIIRSAGDPDRKEARLRQLEGGSLYRQIFNDYYPQLRRSDYRIEYSVVPFSVEKGKEVLLTRPGDLSLNEMFMIANTYKAGSAEFNKVFETAAQLFPASDEANLNAAASALGRNDTTLAARYLDRVKDRNEVYWNNLGVLAWQQGDMQKASECFAKGGARGMDNAAELLKHMESRTNR